MYGKVSCWSNNHTQQEHNESKKKYGDCYPKSKVRPNYEQNFQHWIMEYNGIDNNKDKTYYFEDLSININIDCTPGSESFYTNSEQFHILIN